MWFYCWKCRRAFRPAPFGWWTGPDPVTGKVQCKWGCMVYLGGACENIVEARPMPTEYNDILESAERLGGPIATRPFVEKWLGKENE